MMRFRIFMVALMFAGRVGYAQPTVTNLSTDTVSHASARIKWQSQPASNRQVAFDTASYWDANQTYRYRTIKQNSFEANQYMNVTGLEPGTEYVACALACDSSGHCRSCGPSDPQVRFSTLPEPQVHPQVPALPDLTGFELGYPLVNATLNVAGDCSDLQSKLTAAASATYSDQTVEVVIPAGTVCTSPVNEAYTLPAKSGGGWVIVRTSALANLPPEGSRITPAYSQHLVVINNPNPATWGIFQFPSSHHYRFVGIQFGHLPIAQANDVKAAMQTYLIRAEGGYIHDMVFDRCYFHGNGYPDRLLYAFVVGSGSERLAFVGNYFDNVDNWRAYQQGITVTHPSNSRNDYTAGTAYLGNAAVAVNAFSIALSGTGSGAFRLYVLHDGSVVFKHNVSDLSATCSGCAVTYDASLAVPSTAFKLVAIDDSGNTAITNAQFKTAGGAATGIPWGIQDATDVGTWEGSVAFMLGEVHKMVVRNNYIHATGMAFFVEQYAYNNPTASASDIELTRNTFASNVDLFAREAGGTNRVGFRRQHVEFKQGVRVLIQGNQFLDAWIGIGGVRSSAVYMANRTNGIPEVAEVSDITIRGNLILDHPTCFTINGTETGGAQSKLTRRLLIENNLCEANARTRKAYYIGQYDGAFGGSPTAFYMGGEDYTIRHNTIIEGRGWAPYLLALSTQWQEGFVVQDNIFYYHNDNTYGGVKSTPDFGDGTASLPQFTYAEGTAALNMFSRRMGDTYPGSGNWAFDHNVIVAGCNDSANCTSETTNLVDPQAKSAIYPPGNYWPTGATFGARVAAVGFRNSGNNDFRLADGSPYRGSGSHPASDNRDVGAQYEELESKLGYVKNVTLADVGLNAALIQYTAPDGEACTVEFGVSPAWGTGSRISDGGGTRQRQVVLPNLVPDTLYQYRILCAVQQPSGMFATPSGSGAPTNLPIRLKPPQGRRIAEALVEHGPSKALGSTTPAIPCSDGCTVLVPGTSGQAVYHRVLYRDTSQTVMAQGATEASIAH